MVSGVEEREREGEGVYLAEVTRDTRGGWTGFANEPGFSSEPVQLRFWAGSG